MELLGGLVAIFCPRNIGNVIIIPSDVHIFQRGGPTTKQKMYENGKSCRDGKLCDDQRVDEETVFSREAAWKIRYFQGEYWVATIFENT